MEHALRFIGTRPHGTPVTLLKHAIERPQSLNGRALAPLTEPTALLSGWTVAERAHALAELIEEGVRDPDVGPERSRERLALEAAFRMDNPEIPTWEPSLTARFKQLRRLFGRPDSTQPMEMAWKRGVTALATYAEARLRDIRTPAAWDRYRPRLASPDAAFRQPSPGAQPVFADLFVTTVFMKSRAVYRRITERLLTAREDDVAYYTARGFAGLSPRRTYVPVEALWGCRAEFVESPQPGRPAVTRLWFPRPLARGEQAHFASEIVDENITADRYWVDVDVDHHGIAQGQLMYGGRLPVSGLTIRVRFDDECLPSAVWWYAELNESERFTQPPPGDRHLLKVVGGGVQHTFTDQACQPREHYGLAFSW